MENMLNPKEMMEKMMGENKMPSMMQNWMKMCDSMSVSVEKSANLSAYATPELRKLFEEWLEQLNEDLLKELEKSSDVKEISKSLNLSTESINYLLVNLSKQGKININVVKGGEENENDGKNDG